MARVFSESWNDYELIDAGNNKKLERWGTIVTIRPERNAYFRPALNDSEWKKTAHFEFVEKAANSGEWITLKKGTPTEWKIQFGELTFNLKLTKFKHVGIFPEQRINWDFVSDNLEAGDRFLNLFGYTGAVSVAARKKGADVFHCDSIKQIIQWGKENMESSHLSDIHWILEDALKFASREVKRGNRYTGIIMDPPAFGLGANKERWKIEDKFEELLKMASDLIIQGGFIIANTYSPRLTEKEIKQSANRIFPAAQISCDTLSIRSKTGKIIEYGELTRILT